MQKYAEYSMLHDAVEVQRRELQSRLSERYVERRLGVPYGDDDLIKVIIGPRRCGKSFLAMHCSRRRLARVSQLRR